jgi:hypothetical protein
MSHLKLKYCTTIAEHKKANTSLRPDRLNLVTLGAWKERFPNFRLELVNSKASRAATHTSIAWWHVTVLLSTSRLIFFCPPTFDPNRMMWAQMYWFNWEILQRRHDAPLWTAAIIEMLYSSLATTWIRSQTPTCWSIPLLSARSCLSAHQMLHWQTSHGGHWMFQPVS